MRRLTMTAEAPQPAPLDPVERQEAVLRILNDHGIFTRRVGHAASVGITITYAHLSEAANGPRACSLLAEHLDWEDTDVADVAGAVAVTTHRG